MADDDRSRDEEIVIPFPLWIVAYKAVQGLPRDARSVITAAHGSRRLLLILAHRDQAERFIRKQGKDDLVALALVNPVDLASLLQTLEGAGVTHVQFDEHPGSPVLPMMGVTAIVHPLSRETPSAGEMQRCPTLRRSLCEDVAIDFWTLPVRAVAEQHDLPLLEAAYRCDYCGQELTLTLPPAAHIWPICPNCGKIGYVCTE